CHILFIESYTPDMTNPDFKLSPDLIPSDGRFGCGPSKVRQAQIDAVVNGAQDVIGTSHRQAAVKNVVGEVRDGLSELFSLPEGYEIVLSLGGATAFLVVAGCCDLSVISCWTNCIGSSYISRRNT